MELIDIGWKYVAWAFFLSLVVRTLVVVARGLEYHFPAKLGWGTSTPPKKSAAHRSHGFLWNAARDFGGCHPELRQRDWFLTYFLGAFEIMAYPLLFKTNHLEAIGFWIAAKTVPHWKQNLSAESYVRFFLGNAAVLIASYFLYIGYFDP